MSGWLVKRKPQGIDKNKNNKNKKGGNMPKQIVVTDKSVKGETIKVSFR